VVRLFLLLSGEHDSLPVSELRAILETEGCEYEILDQFDQLIRLEADLHCTEALERRAAFTRMYALELFNCEARMSSIVKAMRSTEFNEVTGKDETFAVRVKHVKEYSAQINGMTLERKLGELILEKMIDSRVNLRRPDKAFVGILTSGKFVFGLKLAEIAPKPFVERRPRNKPFFHPSAMQPKLARCMVNLARPKAGDLLLDPFCGTGTMLIEAALIGCRVLGLDVQRRMARGTVKNMTHFKLTAEGVLVADARNLPIARIDCVVTDPPYGISSSTLKRSTTQLVEQLLTSSYELLNKGQKICLAAPRTLKIVQIGIALGYRHLESHLVYVHRSLTREIVVFEKV
jgi:tRNA (guanine10-N2)-dimethyltransferase